MLDWMKMICFFYQEVPSNFPLLLNVSCFQGVVGLIWWISAPRYIGEKSFCSVRNDFLPPTGLVFVSRSIWHHWCFDFVCFKDKQITMQLQWNPEKKIHAWTGLNSWPVQLHGTLLYHLSKEVTWKLVKWETSFVYNYWWW